MLNLDYQADLFVPSSRTEIDVNFFNKRFKAIFDQLSAFDAVITEYGIAESTLVQLGLARLNDTLGPLLTTLQNASGLGFLVCQSSGNVRSLTEGAAVGWTITDNADLFTPTPFLLAVDVTDSTNWGILSVDPGGWTPPQPNHTPLPILTGDLATHVVYCTKTQTSSLWSISANAAFIPAMNTMMNATISANNSAQAALTSIASDVGDINTLINEISAGPVASVAGRTGIVVLSISDIIGLTTTLAGKASTTDLASKQAASSKLDALVNLTWAANKMIYATGASTLGAADFTDFGRSLLNALNAAAAITALGLAPIATSGAYSSLSGTPTLGSAAPLNVGTGPNNVVQLDGSSRLPAVNGSQLTNLPIPPAPPVGGFIQNNIYNIGGTQTITIPDGASRAYVRLVGAGGGVQTHYGSPMNGGDGSYVEQWLTGLTPGHTLSITIGAAGVTSYSGSNGGDSRLSSGSQSIPTLIAGGGRFGTSSSAGAGGVTTGGDLSYPGANGDVNGDWYTAAVVNVLQVLWGANWGAGAVYNGYGAGGGIGCIQWFS